MAAWRVDIPPHVAAVIRALPPEVKRGVRNALRALSEDPLAGGPLLRELEGLRKFRVRRYRIVYERVPRARVIRVMAVGHRESIYEDLAAQIVARGGRPG